MRQLMSRAHLLTNRFRYTNTIHSINLYNNTNLFKSTQYIQIHNISSSSSLSSTISNSRILSTRHFSDRKGSFKQPQSIQDKPKQADNDQQIPSSSLKPKIYSSKTTTQSFKSTTKIKKTDDKTQTVSTKTVSHNTELKNSKSDVKMKYSQQVQKTTEMDNGDPTKKFATTSTQTYKKMDIKSTNLTDTHTEIKSHTETLSGISDNNNDNNNNNNNNNNDNVYTSTYNHQFDIYLVGNPTSAEILWRRSQLSPHALIIHPERLLPVLTDEAYERRRQSKLGFFGKVRRKIHETYTSVRDRVVGDERYQSYSQTIRNSTDVISDQWDTSQNYHLVKLRSLLDRMNLQTESSRAMEILQDDFSDFWVEDFLPEFNEKLLPLIVRAWFNDDMDFLNTICIGEASVFCKNIIEQRINENKMLAPDILWINEADIIETKLNNKIPQLIIRTEIQCVDCIYERGTDNVLEGSPSTIATNVFVFVLEPNCDDEYIKCVPLPWQIRSLSTARQRQIV